jgi:hypothetical protein
MALLAGLGGAGMAQATLVVGVFDPNFGGPLNGTNYSGTATFSIDQNCLNLPLADATGVFVYSTNQCNGQPSGMSFLGASVNFTGAQTGQVTFAASAGEVLGMFIQNHQVVGVQSMVIGPAASTLSGSPTFDLLFGQPNPVVDPGEGLIPTRNDGDNDYDDMAASKFETTSLFLVSNVGNFQCSAASPCVSAPASTVYVSTVPELPVWVLLPICFLASRARWTSTRSGQAGSSRHPVAVTPR